MSAPCRHRHHKANLHRVKSNIKLLSSPITYESHNPCDYQHRSLAAPKGGRDESYSALGLSAHACPPLMAHHITACVAALLHPMPRATAVTADARAKYLPLLRLLDESSPAAFTIQVSMTTAAISPAIARAKALVFNPLRALKPSRVLACAMRRLFFNPLGLIPMAKDRAWALLVAHLLRGEKLDTTHEATSSDHGVIVVRCIANCCASLYHARASTRDCPLRDCAKVEYLELADSKSLVFSFMMVSFKEFEVRVWRCCHASIVRSICTVSN